MSKLPEFVLERLRTFPDVYNRTAGKPLREMFEEAAQLGYDAGKADAVCDRVHIDDCILSWGHEGECAFAVKEGKSGDG